MRPVLRRDRPRGAALLEVVADDGGGAQRVFEVRLGELSALVGRVLPDAGEAVRLQLEAYRAKAPSLTPTVRPSASKKRVSR